MDLIGESKPSTSCENWRMSRIVSSTIRVSRFASRHSPQMIEDGENPDEEVFGLVAKLRNWEQNRVAMEPATIALMRILAREPEAALRALRRHAA